jgi:hypothetical protein
VGLNPSRKGSGGGKKGGDDGKGGGINPIIDKQDDEALLKALRAMLDSVYRHFVHFGYITYYAYRPNEQEYNPRLMEEYRRSGVFERYGIWDRARYPNLADCPYPVTNLDSLFEVYERILNVIWLLDPSYLARPLPSLDPGIYDSFMTGFWITFIQAAILIDIPLVHDYDPDFFGSEDDYPDFFDFFG